MAKPKHSEDKPSASTSRFGLFKRPKAEDTKLPAKEKLERSQEDELTEVVRETFKNK